MSQINTMNASEDKEFNNTGPVIKVKQFLGKEKSGSPMCFGIYGTIRSIGTITHGNSVGKNQNLSRDVERFNEFIPQPGTGYFEAVPVKKVPVPLQANQFVFSKDRQQCNASGTVGIVTGDTTVQTRYNDRQQCNDSRSDGKVTGDTTVQPRYTDRQQCETTVQPRYTDRQQCDTTVQPRYTDRQQCDTTVQPRYTDWQQCDTTVQPRYTDRQQCDTTVQPRYTDWQQCNSSGTGGRVTGDTTVQPRYTDWQQRNDIGTGGRVTGDTTGQSRYTDRQQYRDSGTGGRITGDATGTVQSRYADKRYTEYGNRDYANMCYQGNSASNYFGTGGNSINSTNVFKASNTLNRSGSNYLEDRNSVDPFQSGAVNIASVSFSQELQPAGSHEQLSGQRVNQYINGILGKYSAEDMEQKLANLRQEEMYNNPSQNDNRSHNSVQLKQPFINSGGNYLDPPMCLGLYGSYNDTESQTQNVFNTLNQHYNGNPRMCSSQNVTQLKDNSTLLNETSNRSDFRNQDDRNYSHGLINVSYQPKTLALNCDSPQVAESDSRCSQYIINTQSTDGNSHDRYAGVKRKEDILCEEPTSAENMNGSDDLNIISFSDEGYATTDSISPTQLQTVSQHYSVNQAQDLSKFSLSLQNDHHINPDLKVKKSLFTENSGEHLPVNERLVQNTYKTHVSDKNFESPVTNEFECPKENMNRFSAQEDISSVSEIDQSHPWLQIYDDVDKWQFGRDLFSEYDEDLLEFVNTQLQQYLFTVGGGVDLTLTELQDMASRQQHQIDDQQQMLVAKEQRLKFLKQQEVRHQQIASENERLRKLREKVEAQELKLKKLRAMRGQVSDQKHTNNSLSSELETIKSLFNDKEKELSVAVNKVEVLSNQLEELRQGRMDGSMTGVTSGENNNTLFELSKLKKEVVIRNKLNEQQHSKLAAHHDILNQRHNEMTSMDKRIAELQQRLRTKKQLQQANRNHSNNVFSSTNGNQVTGSNNKTSGWGGNNNNVAAVEPYHRVNNNNNEDSSAISKQDPKYQSLPYNVKFPNQGNKENRGGNNKVAGVRGQISTGVPVNKALQKVTGMGQDTSNSPSILYASGESPGSPMTSTPVTSSANHQQQPSVNNNMNTATALQHHQSTPVSSKTQQHHLQKTNSIKEIFITGAPVSPKSSSSQQQQHVQSTTTTNKVLPNSSDNIRLSQPINSASSTSISPTSFSTQNHARTGSNDSSGSASQHHHMRTGSNESAPASPYSQQQHGRQGSDDHTYGGGVRSESMSALPRVNPPHQAITRQVNSDSNIHNMPPQQSTGKPVRYASRDVIANTYTGKHSSEAMDQYRKNMNQLYKDFKAGAGDSPPGQSSDKRDYTKEGSPTATVKPFQQNQQPHKLSPTAQLQPPQVQQQQPSPTHVQIGSTAGATSTSQHPGSVSPVIKVEGTDSPDENYEPGKYGAVYNIDPERSRYGKQQLHAPRPLRRRHSSGGDSSPDAKQKHTAQSPEGKGPSSPQSPATKAGVPPTLPMSPPDIVNVSHTLNEEEEDDDSAFTEGTTAVVPVITGTAIDDIPFADEGCESPAPRVSLPVALRRRKGNLKSKDYVKSSRRVSFDPLALLLDAALEGELDLVTKSAHEVSDPSCPNDEGITALHNAICAGHYDIVKFLVEYGCDVNSPDSDGWTPLHCAASCNNLGMVRILVEHGACIFAETISDQETAAEKCEEDEEGYHGCSEYLYRIQEKLGIANKGEVFAVFDYESAGTDELSFNAGDSLFVLRKGDEQERDWWWARPGGTSQRGSKKSPQKAAYIPRNLLGMFARAKPQWLNEDK